MSSINGDDTDILLQYIFLSGPPGWIKACFVCLLKKCIFFCV